MGKNKKPEKKKFIGSLGLLWFLIIFLWPIAIFYFAMNREYPSKIKYI